MLFIIQNMRNFTNNNINNYPLFRINDISQFFNLDFETKVSYKNKVIHPLQNPILILIQ